MAEERTAPGMQSRYWRLGLGWLTLLAAALFALVPSCLERRSDLSVGVEARCTSCHGDPSRAGDFLQRAAPPRDLSGASSRGYPGVGAHAIHLYSRGTHAAVACSECHVVPERVDSPGHADDGGPAELVFGRLASKGGRAPRYDVAGRTCSDSWCHRSGADAVWTEPRTSSLACGSCHGLPPALPHPNSDRCAACHAAVMDESGRIVAPALHVDGLVQANPGSCGACHGSGDDPAPASGAHLAHLAGGAFSRPLACGECHSVPETADEEGHIEGRPARVQLSGVASSHDRSPSWARQPESCADAWCHGPSGSAPRTSPSWSSTEPLACTSCHGAPPPAPHPQLADCATCHGAVVGVDNTTIIDRARHVDGVVDVSFESSCTSCHGGENLAPPRAVNGERATSFAGVGAHQAHLQAGSRSRAVACGECHRVPADSFSRGHLDSELPAEVEFAGVARAFDAAPTYEDGSCVSTPCHGGKFPGTHRSGGTNLAPRWTEVPGTGASCGSCHALPPPAPHPYAADCSGCHENMAKDNVSFVRPELHVDGVVTFTLP